MNTPELITLIALTIITVIVPGPDFLIVSRNAVVHSRKAGWLTACGVATAVWVHISYSIGLVHLASSQSQWLFQGMKYAGACYLIYLGYQSLKTRQDDVHCAKSSSNGNFWLQGFINNALNPKATLFFISVFSQVISSDTSIWVQVEYGLVITAICLGWFILLPYFLTTKPFKSVVNTYIKPIEKVAGVMFIGFGLYTMLG